MADVYDLNADSFQYPKNIAITDKQGDLHFFSLHHIFMGSMVHWNADEENGSYHVEMDAPPEEPADRQIHNFHKKIVEKLWNRSLEKHTIDGYELTSLQDHGNLDIRYSNEKNETVFVIDGKTFSAEKFMELLRTYEGWTMQFQIRSASDGVLKENERLMPVDVSKESILEELKLALFFFSVKSKTVMPTLFRIRMSVVWKKRFSKSLTNWNSLRKCFLLKNALKSEGLW